MTATYNNCHVPFIAKINGGLLGRKITIQGCVNPAATRIDINLKLGSGKNDNIAFHCNPRFHPNDSFVVRNTMFHGAWGTEERHHQGQYPFKQGREYKFEIVCEEDRFVMYVDGKFLAFYNHRVPPSAITYLEITRDTEVSSIQISEKNTNSEIDEFCKMLAEKLKKLPTHEAAKAQSVFLMKLLEIETSR